MINYFKNFVGSIVLLLVLCATPSVAKAVDKNTCFNNFVSETILMPYKAIHTLNKEKWNEYMEIYGIKEICVPKSLGSPSINANWDHYKPEADGNGRKISIGFKNTYEEDIGGWGNLYMEYSTYDFSAGMEYFMYADNEDYTSINSGIEKDPIVNIGGSKAFVTISKAYYFDENDHWYEKKYVFPYDNYYIAFVLRLDQNYEEEILLNNEKSLSEIYSNERYSDAFDALVSSVNFEKTNIIQKEESSDVMKAQTSSTTTTQPSEVHDPSTSSSSRVTIYLTILATVTLAALIVRRFFRI